MFLIDLITESYLKINQDIQDIFDYFHFLKIEYQKKNIPKDCFEL